MKKPIKIAATLEQAKTAKEPKTLKLTFITQEIDYEISGKLMMMKHNHGWLAFVPNSVEYDNKVEIPDHNAPFEGKSLSQRLRNMLHVYWEKKQLEQPFDDFYRSYIETLISDLQEKINP